MNIDEKCWTLDKPMTFLSTCHLGLCLGLQSCEILRCRDSRLFPYHTFSTILVTTNLLMLSALPILYTVKIHLNNVNYVLAREFSFQCKAHISASHIITGLDHISSLPHCIFPNRSHSVPDSLVISPFSPSLSLQCQTQKARWDLICSNDE